MTAAAATTAKSLAIICGVGEGFGAALASAFSAHHSCALLARSKQKLDAITAELCDSGADAAAFSCDVSSLESVQSAFSGIKEKYPEHQLKAAIFNASSPFIMKPFLELQATDLQPSIDVNINGAFHFSQQVIPLLLEAGGGFLSFTGATASFKGGAKFAAFAPGKFAVRALSQSLAREFGPLGIHVSHSIVDGLIGQRGITAEGDDTHLDPDAMAATILHLSEQPKTGWTYEIVLRPAKERW
ncbi:hypothetical protein JCM11641_003767 [Rhodosporidiobolus odoratus]